MRRSILAASAAFLAALSLGVPADAAPKRKPPASALAKKKAAGAAAEARAAAARAAAEAAEQARLRPAWGLLADLADRDLEYGGAPMLLRWGQPMRVLNVTTYGAKGNDAFVFAVDPATMKLTGRSLTGKDSRVLDFFVAPTGEIMWSALGKPERFMWREKDGSIRQRWSAGSTRTFKPLDPTGRAGVTLAGLVAKGEVARLAGTGAIGTPGRLYTADEGLSFFRSLQGSWSNGRMILNFRSGANAVAYEYIHAEGTTGVAAITSDGGKLVIDGHNVAFVPGGFLLPTPRYAYFPQADGSFEVRMARLGDGALKPEKERGYSVTGKWARVGESDVLAFRKQAEGTRLANLEAQRQKQASGGGGGMFGKMLGGALMGAMLGGGGANSLEMAVIGATNAANGGNTLDGLNAMNGVMQTKVEESKRQLDATIARAEAQAAAQRAAASQAATGGGARTGGSAATPARVASSSIAPGTPAAASPASAPPGDKLTRKAIRVYLWQGLVPTDKDVRNPQCWSNAFPVTIDWNERGWGNAGRADAAISPYYAAFTAKCARYRQLSDKPSYFAEGVTGWSEPRAPRESEWQVSMP